MDSFVQTNFLKHSIFNWDDFNHLLKNHDKSKIDLIGEKEKFNLTEKKEISIDEFSLIFSDCLNYKKDFQIVCDFLKLKYPFLNKSVKNDVHIYAGHNNKSSRSFGYHFDHSDNFILQTEGKSRWIVPQGHIDCILNPGDILWIPKMVVHCCIPLDRRISLSFPFWY